MFGHQEVRLHGVSYTLLILALFDHTPQEPFPLYPGESLEGATLAGESILVIVHFNNPSALYQTTSVQFASYQC